MYVYCKIYLKKNPIFLSTKMQLYEILQYSVNFCDTSPFLFSKMVSQDRWSSTSFFAIKYRNSLLINLILIAGQPSK